jgi:hypothetical protein
MLHISAYRNLRCGGPDSRLKFESDGWMRYLTIDGARAYHLGGSCQTCGFLFERLDGANKRVEIEETVAKLREGVESLDEDAVSVIGRGLPEDDYSVMLAAGCVTQVTPGKANDYFTGEQIALWGEDNFWCLPHDPRIAYFRAGEQDMGERRRLFHFIVPMFPSGWLRMGAVGEYVKSLTEKASGTAVSIATLEVRAPAEYYTEQPPDPSEHWCLTHYLLDGHHKLHAAEQNGKPVSLLSFIIWSESMASRGQIEEVLAFMATPVGSTPVNS